MRGFLNVFVCLLVVLSVGSAFGAGIPMGDSQNLGGSFYPSGFNGMPSFGSSSSDNGTQVYGSFWLNLDANTTSLSYANWNFYTNSSDTSLWTATCYLHGLRNSYTACPQNKSWSGSSTDENGVSLSANTNLNCYDMYADQINNLLTQIADLQSKLTNAKPEDISAIQLQLQLAQLQLSLIQAQDKQVLGVSGNFNISPSILQGSNFNYSDTTDNSYSWPNGYDHDPVITLVPSWNAEFDLHGQFVAPTLAEAQAMGAPFAQSVPEPSTFVLIAIAIVGISLAAYRRRKRG
jgi:hypothetical protein